MPVYPGDSISSFFALSETASDMYWQDDNTITRGPLGIAANASNADGVFQLPVVNYGKYSPSLFNVSKSCVAANALFSQPAPTSSHTPSSQ
jgi:hypothetical protein